MSFDQKKKAPGQEKVDRLALIPNPNFDKNTRHLWQLTSLEVSGFTRSDEYEVDGSCIKAEGVDNKSAGGCTVIVRRRGDNDASGRSLFSRVESAGMAVGGPTPHMLVGVGAAIMMELGRWNWQMRVIISYHMVNAEMMYVGCLYSLDCHKICGGREIR